MLTKILLLGGALLAAACQATNPAAIAQLPAGSTPPSATPVGGGSEKLFAHR